MRIVVVGLGGIGSWVVQSLVRFLYRQENCTLVLVDGDTYEDKNKERQFFQGSGKKALVQGEWIRKNFSGINVMEVPDYIVSDQDFLENDKDNTSPISDVIRKDDYVFVCVDNHATKKIIIEYCSTLPNIVVFAGGNEWTDGNVWIYWRKNGKDRTKNPFTYHSELIHPKDRNPADLSCEELAVSDPQLIFTNMFAAVLLMNAFYAFLEGKLDYYEVYFDILQNKALPCKLKG